MFTPEIKEQLQQFIDQNPDQLINIKNNWREIWKHVRVETRQKLADLLWLWCSYKTDVDWTTALATVSIVDKMDTAIAWWSWYASKDEPFLQWSPMFCTVAMAETRAFSKAMRNRFWFAMIEMWYVSTPAEEMIFVPWSEGSIDLALNTFKKW